jgi:hypothetical protein
METKYDAEMPDDRTALVRTPVGEASRALYCTARKLCQWAL